jgi:hypothetical protein
MLWKVGALGREDCLRYEYAWWHIHIEFHSEPIFYQQIHQELSAGPLVLYYF